MFFDFVMDVSAKTHTFESLFWEDGLARLFIGQIVFGHIGRNNLIWSNTPILLAKVELSRDVFFYFFMDVSAKIPTFESLLAIIARADFDLSDN